MAITKILAAKQVKRLKGLSFFPVEPAAAHELVLALMEAESEECAAAAIGSLLATSTECPKPSHIHRLLGRSASGDTSMNPDCSEAAEVLAWADASGYPVLMAGDLWRAQDAMWASRRGA